MKIYELKPNQQRAFVPEWHFDPATVGQLKVLRFFEKDVSGSLTKGVCSGIIGRLFSDPANKHLWNAYVYTADDYDRSSTDLKPHDKTVLAHTEIPDDWKPKRSSPIPGKTYEILEQLVEDILKDGSPFDDPLPEIVVAGKAFYFTSKFQFGTRKECEAAIVSRGGTTTDGITSKTDVLVIGDMPNPNWSHGSYGNKIVNAMILKLHRRKPLIIPERYWCAILGELDGETG